MIGFPVRSPTQEVTFDDLGMELALAFGPPVACKVEAQEEVEPTLVDETATHGQRQSKAKRPLSRRASCWSHSLFIDSMTSKPCSPVLALAILRNSCRTLQKRVSPGW